MLTLLSAEEPAEGFRFTQGWASIGTITVGVLALVIATIYNRTTLIVSAERHTMDRRDKYNESVRKSVVAIATEVLEWTGHCSFQFVGMDLLSEDIARPKAQNSTERIRTSLTTANREEFIPAHRRLHSALFATRLLTTDEAIAPVVNKMLAALYGVREIRQTTDYDSPDSLLVSRTQLKEVYEAIIFGMEELEQVTVVKFPFVLEDDKAGTAIRQPPLRRTRP
ncbi:MULTISPECIES: hypothetical protein [unclassified Rhodococcus (in: high G+C Gram-positive bacteria)]|uniref:hypothetical protein n=1 Tax=unclassified Rhodococcus (in: high G+C Gram-positive bacteria) TaxID=192944 RepID=UPI00117AF39A|nr:MULTISPECIES: hypothetical protein [unclassified Rhodococcus (in: high G+C Gram-positive bacteria)]